MKTYQIHLSEEEVRFLKQIPPCLCSTCAYLQTKIKKDSKGFSFIDSKDLKNEGVAEHLRQLLRQELGETHYFE